MVLTCLVMAALTTNCCPLKYLWNRGSILYISFLSLIHYFRVWENLGETEGHCYNSASTLFQKYSPENSVKLQRGDPYISTKPSCLGREPEKSPECPVTRVVYLFMECLHMMPYLMPQICWYSCWNKRVITDHKYQAMREFRPCVWINHTTYGRMSVGILNHIFDWENKNSIDELIKAYN